MTTRSFEDPRFSATDEALLPTPEPPIEAPKAAKCECKKKGNEPWLERDVDGFWHCNRCGSDY